MTFPNDIDLQAFVGEHLPSFEVGRVKAHLRDCLPCALRVADLKCISANAATSPTAWGLPRTTGCGGESESHRHDIRFALCG